MKIRIASRSSLPQISKENINNSARSILKKLGIWERTEEGGKERKPIPEKFSMRKLRARSPCLCDSDSHEALVGGHYEGVPTVL